VEFYTGAMQPASVCDRERAVVLRRPGLKFHLLHPIIRITRVPGCQCKADPGPGGGILRLHTAITLSSRNPRE